MLPANRFLCFHPLGASCDTSCNRPIPALCLCFLTLLLSSSLFDMGNPSLLVLLKILHCLLPYLAELLWLKVACVSVQR